MRKTFVILLCLLMLFAAGCNEETPVATQDTAQPSEPTVPVETTQPTMAPTEPEPTEPPVTEPPVPETTPGTVLADRTMMILETAQRGSTVEVVGEFDADYWVVKTEIGYGLIEKRLVRMDGEAAYEQWQGYAKSGAGLYDHYHLLAPEIQSLTKNAKVQVLEGLGDCYLVQVGDTTGYMRQDQVSKSYIKSSSGGGSADGGDISLDGSWGVSQLSVSVPQSGEITGSATVLADNAEISLGWFDRSETVQIVTQDGFAPEKEGYYTIYLEGLYGYMRQNLAAQEGTEPDEPWQGYARSKAPLYDSYYLTGDPVKSLSANAKVQVVCDLGTCYLVQVGEETGYMAKDQVSETRIQYSSGSGGNEWSDPVM